MVTFDPQCYIPIENSILPFSIKYDLCYERYTSLKWDLFVPIKLKYENIYILQSDIPFNLSSVFITKTALMIDIIYVPYHSVYDDNLMTIYVKFATKAEMIKWKLKHAT